jgi:hypothetical protein
MMTCLVRLNLYLVLVATVGLFCGCASPERKRTKALSTIRLHQEMRADASGRTIPVQVLRAQPFSLTVEKQPFLDDGSVKEAKVVDALGGFAIEIKFDKKGGWLLENYTSALRGKHLAIFAQWGIAPEYGLNEGRWLAAPLVTDRITSGVLLFTPDATRQEADQIVSGLNNVAKKLKTGRDDVLD